MPKVTDVPDDEMPAGQTNELPQPDALTYEAARDELMDVVRRLETGGATLEDSLALWERGEALAARCQALLDGARERLDAALADEDEESDGEPDEDD